MGRLAEAVSRLGKPERALYEARQAGATLQEVADKFRLSLRTIERHWHAIVASLRREMHSFLD